MARSESSAYPPSRWYKKAKQYSTLLYFGPIAFLLLERLYIPFEFKNLASYLNVQDTAVTTKAKVQTFDPSTAPPPLEELAGTHGWLPSCPSKTQAVENTPRRDTSSTRTHKIPKIIHMTAKHKCLTKAFVENTNKWRLDDFAFFLHDDYAINTLLMMNFPEFPNLSQILRNCVTNGTMKADLWRYLLLYVYGGIYADIDTAPIEFDANTITPEMDAFFVLEQLHTLSQWFMAVSPRHPLMYYAIQRSLQNILESEDTMQIGANTVTGTHALHAAFQDFRRDVGVIVDELGSSFKPIRQAGVYEGTNGRSITVQGTSDDESAIVQRQAVDSNTHKKDFSIMGMTHFSKFIEPDSKRSGISCLDAILQDTSKAIDEQRSLFSQ